MFRGRRVGGSSTLQAGRELDPPRDRLDPSSEVAEDFDREPADALHRSLDRDDTLVTVTMEGAAELASIASARPKTTERADAASWETFDGRVLTVVRPRSAGQATATVQGDGLDTAAMNLQIVDGGG